MSTINMGMIYVALLAYVGNMFKTNISELFGLLKLRYTSSIFADRGASGYFIYDEVSRIVSDMDYPILKNNRELRYNNMQLSTGRYPIYKGKLTWMIISVLNEKKENNDNNRIITVTFVGFKHRQLKDEILSQIDFGNKSRARQVRSLSRPSIFSSDLKPKAFDSIFMTNKDKLIKALDGWLSMENYFKAQQITYKLGMLLHGDPGTGKTSLINAIALYCNMDVVIIDTISADLPINENTIYVIEEVDCIFEGDGNRDKVESANKNNKQNLSKLLQLLDGLESPHKCLFILTTNHKEHLDPALFRPGRIDLDIHMGSIPEEIAIEMCDKFKCDHSILDQFEMPVNPSKLQLAIMNEKVYKNMGINHDDKIKELK